MVRARPSPAADHLCDRGAGEEGPSTTCAQPGRLPAFLPGEDGTTKSSPPLGGKFQIKCKNEQGQMSLS